MNVPVSKLADALPVMADVALRPTFPQTDLDRLKKERLTALLQARDNPGALLVVGDVTPASILPLLEKNFGAWKAEGMKALVADVPVAPQLKSRAVYI